MVNILQRNYLFIYLFFNIQYECLEVYVEKNIGEGPHNPCGFYHLYTRLMHPLEPYGNGMHMQPTKL